MPTIISTGAGSARGFGFAGKGVVLAPSTAITLIATNPTRGSASTSTYTFLPGYSAGIYIFAVGDGSQQGSSYPYTCGRSSSGEFAQFSYTCTGAETSLTIGWNINGTGTYNNIHRFTVVGGANNGTYCQVGSNANGYDYGNACPPTQRSNAVSAAFSRITFGAYADNAGNYYSDDYYYPPCDPGGGYGTNQNGYNGYGAGNGCNVGIVGAVYIQYRNNY